MMTLWLRSFGVNWIRISDPRSLGSWCIKGTDESVTRVDSSVLLIQAILYEYERVYEYVYTTVYMNMNVYTTDPIHSK